MKNRQTRDQALFHNQWNAELYECNHAFVSQLGADLVELLSPQKGERILDLGCGTGHLAHAIASNGAEVIGIDAASTMVEKARSYYPTLHFEVRDATNLQFVEEFDAVFSNAVLHWITAAEQVVAGIWQALKPGGRFVAEFGGKGNVQAIVKALGETIRAAGYPVHLSWYFPSIGEYSSLLEKHKFEVTFTSLFDRPTPLNEGEEGMRNWIEMFAHSLFQEIPAEQQIGIMTKIEDQLRPKLYQDGIWFVDYRRIRVVAVKV